jgi:hypothetical protein
MAMVWPCPVDVDAYVEGGAEIKVPRPPCPECRASTWHWAGYVRHLRRASDRLIWVPRLCCTGCGKTQALIPWFVLPWRWDEVSVIGRAVELAAQDWGHRRIAQELGRPATTVRGWLRRIRRWAGQLGRELLAVAVAWGWSSWEVPPLALPRLVTAVVALGEQWQRRRGYAEPWRVANLVTGGSLVATNITLPLAGARASGWMAGSSDSEVPDGP